jgi:ABC-type uncharacterized transport system fused permease/ATPase subunit
VSGGSFVSVHGMRLAGRPHEVTSGQVRSGQQALRTSTTPPATVGVVVGLVVVVVLLVVFGVVLVALGGVVVVVDGAGVALAAGVLMALSTIWRIFG